MDALFFFTPRGDTVMVSPKFLRQVIMMTRKQQRFCDEYLIDCNATQAAIRAGYSAKTAYSIGVENLKKPEIKEYIDERLEQIQSGTIASAEEVMRYLTSVLRSESRSSVLALDEAGGQNVIEKAPDERERLKAAELLGKRYSLYTDKVNMDGSVPIVFADESALED